MSINIVVPVKDSCVAKQRLMPVLNSKNRRKVALFLCHRTLAFFKRHFPREHLSVVTSSAEMAEIAISYGAVVIPEPEISGLTAAAQLAAEWSVAHGFHSQLIVPADIAELSVEEISHVLSMVTLAPSVIVCQSVDERTHALLTTPPNVIEFAFGENSSWRHLRQANELGIACRLLRLPKLSHDIDTPADLAQLNQHRRSLVVEGVSA